MFIKKSFIILLLSVCAVLPAHSQKNKALLKGVDAMVNRQAAADLFARQKTIYDAALGYIVPVAPMPPHPQGALTAFTGLLPKGAHFEQQLIQVAPLRSPLQDVHQAREFVRGMNMTAGELTQAAYLWQLAHSWQSLEKYSYLYKQVQETVSSLQKQFSADYVKADPNLQFLERMLNPGFKSFTYAKLLELTPVYPKHITLDEQLFPVKTPQADTADLLDVYLMLSNPREMGAFANVSQGPAQGKIYRPFVLTQEESQAANALLSRRLDAEKLPISPTPRDLIEQAYNRLETHTLPYSRVNSQTPATFQAYPDYKNTSLYRSIKGTIIGQWPVIWVQNGRHILQNPQEVHLIVLDAVMGGVDIHNYQEVNRVLESFRELCAVTTPTEEHIAHLQVLQNNLRIVFNPLIQNYLQLSKQTYGLTPNWALRHISYAVWDTVVSQDVRNLAGKGLE